MGFFKQYVQSGNFPVFGFKLLIVYSLKIAYLLAVLFLHVSHFRIILYRMITERRDKRAWLSRLSLRVYMLMA